MNALAPILMAAMPALTLAGGLHDLTTMKIPNWISGLLILFFFPAALVVGLSAVEIGLCLLVGLAALAVGLAMFAFNWIGGGDAKLMAATCLWMGMSGAVPFLIWTALFGGAFSLLLLSARKFGAPLAAAGPAWTGRLLAPKGDIPYGVAIAAGALAAFPDSAVMLGFAGL